MVLNSLDYIAAYFAAARIGAIAVRLNFQAGSAELDFILKDSGCTAVVLHTSRLSQLAPIRESVAVRTRLSLDDSKVLLQQLHGRVEIGEEDGRPQRRVGDRSDYGQMIDRPLLTRRRQSCLSRASRRLDTERGTDCEPLDLASAHQLLRDDIALDLVRALAHDHQRCVAEVSLDVVFGRVPVTAVDPHGG